MLAGDSRLETRPQIAGDRVGSEQQSPLRLLSTQRDTCTQGTDVHPECRVEGFGRDTCLGNQSLDSQPPSGTSPRRPPGVSVRPGFLICKRNCQIQLLVCCSQVQDPNVPINTTQPLSCYPSCKGQSRDVGRPKLAPLHSTCEARLDRESLPGAHPHTEDTQSGTTNAQHFWILVLSSCQGRVSLGVAGRAVGGDRHA